MSTTFTTGTPDDLRLRLIKPEYPYVPYEDLPLTGDNTPGALFIDPTGLMWVPWEGMKNPDEAQIRGYKAEALRDDEIGDDAFYNCKTLVAIILPEGIRRIGCCAFSLCNSLTNVHLPRTLRKIDECAFWNSTRLSNLRFPPYLTEIARTAFSWTGIEFLWLPDSVTEIGDLAFARCPNLVYAKLPHGLKRIKFATFQGCSKLSEVVFPEKLQEIENDAFAECHLLSNNLPKLKEVR